MSELLKKISGRTLGLIGGVDLRVERSDLAIALLLKRAQLFFERGQLFERLPRLFHHRVLKLKPAFGKLHGDACLRLGRTPRLIGRSLQAFQLQNIIP